MAELDYFTVEDQTVHSVEYYLNLVEDPKTFPNREDWANWRKAKDIKEEHIRRQADERAARIKAQKERIAYSDELATEITDRIASGELLTVICANDPNMPTAKNVVRWLQERSDFNALYQNAIKNRLFIFEEEIIRLSDELAEMKPQRATASSTKEKIQFIDPVQATKMRVEVRQRHLKAGLPQKWGDQSTLTVKQDDPFECASLSDEELERKIADLDEKESIMKKSKYGT